MLTPQDAPSGERLVLPEVAVTGRRWRRALVRAIRRNLAPWLAVKGLLVVLVFSGQLGVWTAFVLDTAASIFVLAYGWWLARR